MNKENIKVRETEQIKEKMVVGDYVLASKMMKTTTDTAIRWEAHNEQKNDNFKINNMKNILNLGLLLFVLIFSSCDKDETIESLENQTLTFDEFFEKVSSMDIQTSKENAIFINYTWNKQNNSITIISSEEKEASWGTALEVASLKNDSNFHKRHKRSDRDKEYQVSCSNGDNSWDNKCSGKWSCGKLISDCLDAGGCAEICRMNMEYYAPEKIFFLEAAPPPLL